MTMVSEPTKDSKGGDNSVAHGAHLRVSPPDEAAPMTAVVEAVGQP